MHRWTPTHRTDHFWKITKLNRLFHIFRVDFRLEGEEQVAFELHGVVVEAEDLTWDADIRKACVYLPRPVIRRLLSINDVDVAIFQQHTYTERFLLRHRVDLLAFEHLFDVGVEHKIAVLPEIEILTLQIELGDDSSVSNEDVGLDQDDARVEPHGVFDSLRGVEAFRVVNLQRGSIYEQLVVVEHDEPFPVLILEHDSIVRHDEIFNFMILAILVVEAIVDPVPVVVNVELLGSPESDSCMGAVLVENKPILLDWVVLVTLVTPWRVFSELHKFVLEPVWWQRCCRDFQHV